MAVTRRNRISNEMLQSLVKAFEDPREYYLAVADTLRVNWSTARSIITMYTKENKTEERPRGGANNLTADKEMKQRLTAIIEENSQLTLRQIHQELRRRKPAKPELSDRMVGKALNGMLVSVKLARSLPADRNRQDVIEKRFNYASWFMNEVVVNPCIVTDEFWYNIWTTRSCGRARVWERVYRQVCGQRGWNVTICLAIPLKASLIYQGRVNMDRFNTFLAELAEHLDENEPTNFINVGPTAHRNAVSPKDSSRLTKLPPYSPFLNIVEQAINVLKTTIKADISSPNIHAKMDDGIRARQQGMPLGEYMHQILLAACQRNMGTITVLLLLLLLLLLFAWCSSRVWFHLANYQPLIRDLLPTKDKPDARGIPRE